MGWRDFCVGAISGATLSLARPPAGITLEEWMTPSGERMALWRAGALIAIAAALIRRRAQSRDARFPAAEIALGAASGFALHGFVLVDLFAIDSTASWLFALVAGLALMMLLGRKDANAPSETDAAPTPVFQRLALAMAGAGIAAVFAAVNSRLCLFGYGTRDDDTIAGATALLIFGVSALAFSPLLARRQLTPAWFGLGVAVAAAAALPALNFLGALSLPRAYDELLQRFQLDSDMRGSFRYDGLLAARVFAVPALIAGLSLASLRSVANLGWVLLGAAIAAILQPNWSEGFSATTIETVAVQASERAALGAGLAGLGALIGALIGVRGAWKTGASVALCAALCLFYARAWNKPAVLPLSPWERVPPRAEWIRETPEGLLTVELQASRGRLATLDRRRLTPTLEELQADSNRWGWSFAVLGREKVVVAGLMTPQRATDFWSYGKAEVWVMCPWDELALELEAALFAGETLREGVSIHYGREWETLPYAGNIAVIACPPIETAARTLSCLDRGPGSMVSGPYVIGWLPAHQDIAQLDWSEQVIASCSHIEDLSIAIVFDGSPTGAIPAGPRAFGGTFAKLRLAVPDRMKAARVHTAFRLVRGEASAAAQAALLLCSAQVQSSPFETRAQRTELDHRALEILLKSGLAHEEISGLEGSLDSFVAMTLEQRRDLDGLTAFAKPLADAHPMNRSLQRAAARADWEFSDYAEAARRLRLLVQRDPYDLQARLWLSESQLRADDPKAALISADELLAIQPNRFDAERLRALAAVRAGDPRGAAWLQRLTQAHPDDAELAAHAKSGPPPPLQPPSGVPGEEGLSGGH